MTIATFFALNIKKYNKLSKNSDLIECDKDSIFLVHNELHVPKNRLISVNEETNNTTISLPFRSSKKEKTYYISITMKFKNAEYQNWIKLKFLKKIIKQDQTYKYIKIKIPYTEGTLSDSRLNITRSELIEKLNELYSLTSSNSSLLSPK